MANSKNKESSIDQKGSKDSYRRNPSQFFYSWSEEIANSEAARSAIYVVDPRWELSYGHGVPSKLPPLYLIECSRRGLVSGEADRIASLLGVTDKEMARLLNQSVSTFHRRAKSERLDAATSERLLMLGRLARHGEAVFQDYGKFTRWLRRPLRLLVDREPLDLMDSPTGILLVEDLLGRIEHGVFS